MKPRLFVDCILWIGFVFIMFLIAACNGMTDIPSILPNYTYTLTPLATTPSPVQATLHPTYTSTPTSTSSPIPTPTLALYTTGPYLFFKSIKGEELNQQIYTIMNPDGSARKEVWLPPDVFFHDLSSSISPSGDWLAVFRGTTDSSHELNLELYNLWEGILKPVAKLLTAAAYEEGLLYYDLYNLAWSPDGRYLAFNAKTDLTPSELYIYDLQNGSITRMTQDNLTAGSQVWSPDSQWIEYSASNLDDSNYPNTVTFSFIKVNEAISQKQSLLENTLSPVAYGWVTSKFFFLYNQSDGCCGPFWLRYIDVTSGKERMLWDGSVVEFEVDPKNLILALSSAPEADIQGTYIVNWNGQVTKISDDIFWNIDFLRNISSPRFMGFDSEKVYTLTSDGSFELFSEKPFGAASSSPDGNWFVLFQEFGISYNITSGMDLYNSSGKFIRTLTSKKAEPIWRPDASGLFILTDKLYYMSIPDGELLLVDDCQPKGCQYWYNANSFVWLP